MKLLDIVQDANRNLLRNKGRTILTIIAIFIGALTLTVTNGIGKGVSNYIDQQLGNIGAEDVLIVQGKSEVFGSGPKKYEEGRGGSGASELTPLGTMLGSDDLKTIKSVRGVVSASPQIGVSAAYIQGRNNEKYRLSVTPYISGMSLAVAAGTPPDDSSTENQIVLLPDYPAVLGFSSARAAIGQKIKLGVVPASGKPTEVEATVIGVQEKTLTSLHGATINQALAGAIYDIQSAGVPTGARDRYVRVLARVAKNVSDTDLADIKSRLAAKGYDATTIKDQIGVFKQVISAIILVLNVFAAIALLAASFGIINTLLMAVQERTKEIGLMKAMGMGGRKIFLLFSLEAILLGFWGSLLGSLAGIGIGTIANRVASGTFLKDLPGFQLTAFSAASVAVIMLIIMAIAFIAGTFPARRASRKDPIEALRYE